MSALRKARMEKCITIRRLSELSDVSEEQIRNIEAGRVKQPRADTLGKLARILDVDGDTLDPSLKAVT